MSTGTVDLSPLMAHVPVDRFDIVDGPRHVKWMAMMERLGRSTDQNPVYVHLALTLTTAASNTPFRRGVALATIFDVKGDVFSFTALFSGRVVSGVYNMETRTGWFNLD